MTGDHTGRNFQPSRRKDEAGGRVVERHVWSSLSPSTTYRFMLPIWSSLALSPFISYRSKCTAIPLCVDKSLLILGYAGGVRALLSPSACRTPSDIPCGHHLVAHGRRRDARRIMYSISNIEKRGRLRYLHACLRCCCRLLLQANLKC